MIIRKSREMTKPNRRVFLFDQKIMLPLRYLEFCDLDEALDFTIADNVNAAILHIFSLITGIKNLPNFQILDLF